MADPSWTHWWPSLPRPLIRSPFDMGDEARGSISNWTFGGRLAKRCKNGMDKVTILKSGNKGENREDGLKFSFQAGKECSAGPQRRYGLVRLRAAAGGKSGDDSRFGYGQLSDREDHHGLRGVHGSDGRGGFRRGSGPRVGLFAEGQLQGRS